MKDRVLPMLWKSGVMNMSVRLLHTTCKDGKSIKKHWMAGITTLQEQEEWHVSCCRLRSDVPAAAQNPELPLWRLNCVVVFAEISFKAAPL